ncbi:hypothetical protein C8R46DRAFT_1281612 [Mycena filopes]|nr:hypothetical protein C8R46DRAFT_1281612 [Mycena filopes]
MSAGVVASGGGVQHKFNSGVIQTITIPVRSLPSLSCIHRTASEGYPPIDAERPQSTTTDSPILFGVEQGCNCSIPHGFYPRASIQPSLSCVCSGASLSDYIRITDRPPSVKTQRSMCPLTGPGLLGLRRRHYADLRYLVLGPCIWTGAAAAMKLAVVAGEPRDWTPASGDGRGWLTRLVRKLEANLGQKQSDPSPTPTHRNHTVYQGSTAQTAQIRTQSLSRYFLSMIGDNAQKETMEWKELEAPVWGWALANKGGTTAAYEAGGGGAVEGGSQLEYEPQGIQGAGGRRVDEDGAPIIMCTQDRDGVPPPKKSDTTHTPSGSKLLKSKRTKKLNRRRETHHGAHNKEQDHRRLARDGVSSVLHPEESRSGRTDARMLEAYYIPEGKDCLGGKEQEGILKRRGVVSRSRTNSNLCAFNVRMFDDAYGNHPEEMRARLHAEAVVKEIDDSHGQRQKPQIPHQDEEDVYAAGEKNKLGENTSRDGRRPNERERIKKLGLLSIDEGPLLNLRAAPKRSAPISVPPVKFNDSGLANAPSGSCFRRESQRFPANSPTEDSILARPVQD